MSGAKDIPILEVVRHYASAELRQRGREWWGCCPFHQEKTPSFAVNPEKNVFHCYGCHAGGSGIDFVIKLHKLSFKEACCKIEEDFCLQQEWTVSPRVNVKSPETLINERIQQAFDWTFEARRALRAELKRRGDNPPEIIIRDIGRLETIESELVGEAEQIATGLLLFKRWGFLWQQQPQRF